MLIKLQNVGFKSSVPLTLPKVTLGNEQIDALLDINTNNIPPVKTKIRVYSELMKKGKWLYNGDSIRVSSNGILLDGQNRLMAAKNAGIELICDLVVGLDDSVFNTIDQGRVRKRGHLLARSLGNTTSTSEANMISTAVAKIISHDLGYSQSSESGKSSKFIVTPDTVYDYIENNPDILDQVQYVKKQFGSRTLLPPATILYIYHIGCRFDVSYTEMYLDKMINALNLNNGETLHHFQQILIRLKSKSVKWSKSELENTIVKVWNSIGRSGLFSIKYSGNMKARGDESHIKFNPPSSASINEMLDKIHN